METFVYSEEDTCRPSLRIVSTGLLISQWGGKETEKERGKKREARKRGRRWLTQKKNRREYVYWSGKEKLLISLAPLHERDRRRKTRYQTTSTTAVVSCRAFGAAFVILLDASLYLCFAELESDLVAQGAQSSR